MHLVKNCTLKYISTKEIYISHNYHAKLKASAVLKVKKIASKKTANIMKNWKDMTVLNNITSKTYNCNNRKQTNQSRNKESFTWRCNNFLLFDDVSVCFFNNITFHACHFEAIDIIPKTDILMKGLWKWKSWFIFRNSIISMNGDNIIKLFLMCTKLQKILPQKYKE